MTQNGYAGENGPSAKLTEADVYEIRDRYEEGGVSHADLARGFAVWRTTIYHITKQITWRHLREVRW
jgi:hypothetical protein